jgi:hypothetical protein
VVATVHPAFDELALPSALFCICLVRRITTSAVIGRVCDLFKGHLDLILGFNTFLPPGCVAEAWMKPRRRVAEMYLSL